VRKNSFIIRVPDKPGSLHRASGIIKKYSGNINRLQFDKRIDPSTVFFEVTASDDAFHQIAAELTAIGYLQTSLKSLSFLKFCVYLPHQSGALDEFLEYTTTAGANIAFIDFDDKGRHPDRLTVSLNLEESSIVQKLLEELKSRYRMDIIEYDTTGKHLDDTVFYVRYAQAVREIIGESEEGFLLSFLADTNHIAQELMDRGNNPHQVFESVLATGRTMRATAADRFYATIQKFRINSSVTLFCFQVPCGGSIYILDAPGERLMIDTGYGIYHHEVMDMFARYGLGDESGISKIVITHADADHAGAAGYFPVPALMHEGTLAIIEKNNRAYRSRSEHSVLEEFYTKMINLFSKFNIPEKVECFSENTGVKRGIFPVIGSVAVGGIELEVLESLGGHTYGQVFLYSRDAGLIFAADSVINFTSLTKERADYSSLAAFLVTSVNVDSDLARTERKALLELADETDRYLAPTGRRCLICGGHGAISVLKDGKLDVAGETEQYTA